MRLFKKQENVLQLSTYHLIIFNYVAVVVVFVSMKHYLAGFVILINFNQDFPCIE